MSQTPRRRWAYAGLILIAVVCGIGSRRFGPGLPGFIAAYAGDTLWALAAFLGIGFVWTRVSGRRVALAALAISYAVEVSQLYQAPWINSVRATTLGSLTLGHGFVPSDFACYTVGVLIGWGGEALADAIRRTVSRKSIPGP
ncbi:DUF2809 domain-containing protein [Singulisphaera sp. PoT]|uniref:ribosomal maturation YjgA family protein n=1 Tax=Singulisphaera sp. PoT TaxID=3411797 RepID=UPI003BF571A9